MTDQMRSKVIEEHPIGKDLDWFRSSFNSICESRSISCSPDALVELRHNGNLTRRRRRAPLTLTNALARTAL
jgi:hypothetical protein